MSFVAPVAGPIRRRRMAFAMIAGAVAVRTSGTQPMLDELWRGLAARIMRRAAAASAVAGPVALASR